MKNLVLVTFLMVSSLLIAQEKENSSAESNTGVFEFKTEVIDYGTIEQNADGVRKFEFKNVGKSPIVISTVKGSCGCTVPTKPKDPILPGETGEIGVKYATNRVGAFTKTVTVTSNASEGTKVLKIKGTVLASEK